MYIHKENLLDVIIYILYNIYLSKKTCELQKAKHEYHFSTKSDSQEFVHPRLKKILNRLPVRFLFIGENRGRSNKKGFCSMFSEQRLC